MTCFFEENSYGMQNENNLPDQFTSPYEISMKNNDHDIHELYANSERPTFSNTQLDNERNLFDNKFENEEFVNPEPIIRIEREEGIPKKKKCGRKRKNENNTNEHNKFSDDNVRRRIKHLLFKYLLEFMNVKIKNIYNNKIGQGFFIKQLQTLNQSQVSNAKITFNQQLLEKNLREIFSDKVTGKLTNVSSEHNKNLIDKLMNEEDIVKRDYFQNLFNLKLKNCFEHFSGNKVIDELEGMQLFNETSEIKSEYLEKYDDGKEYIQQLEYYLKDYENIIKNKRARRERKIK